MQYKVKKTKKNTHMTEENSYLQDLASILSTIQNHRQFMSQNSSWWMIEHTLPINWMMKKPVNNKQE